MKTGRVTWVDYTIDDGLGVLVRLSVRLENGKKENCYVEGTEPYIFVPKDEQVPNEEYIVRTEFGYESLFDDELKKVVTETPKQAGGLTDEFSKSFEGDIPYYRRLAVHDSLSGYVELPDTDKTYKDRPLYHIDDIEVDADNSSEISPRICLEDIEVRVPDDCSFDEMTENGSEPINVITCYDTYEEDYTVFFYDKYDNLDKSKISGYIEDQLEETDIYDYTEADMGLYCLDSELEMLEVYINYVNERQPDVLSGWNHTSFDFQYIRNRLKTLYSEGYDIHYSWLSPFDTSDSSKAENRKICGLPSFDMMESFTEKLSFSNWRSKSLEYVSNEELGIGKIDDVNINEDWKNNSAKLCSYNLIDVLLLVALDDKNDIHDFFYEMADVCSIPVYDTMFEMRLVDGYILFRREEDEILPTADESELVENAGGYVAEPFDGIKENIGVSDAKSLYPSAILTWNLSTETVAESPEEFEEYVKVPKVPEPKDVAGEIDGELIDWDWLYASFDKEGLVPRTTKGLFEKRNREKKKMYEAEDGSDEEEKWKRKQASTKIVQNSVYGVLSSKYYRLSNEYLGDAVTSTARYTLWKGKQTIDKLNYSHAYSDTDSHAFELESNTLEKRVEELEQISEKMNEEASEIFADIYPESFISCEVCGSQTLYDQTKDEYYCSEHSTVGKTKHPYLKNTDLHGDDYTAIKWESEKIFSRLLMPGKKKRYAGNLEWEEGTVYDDAKISVTGLESQRSDSMPITAKLQNDVLEMILTDASFGELSDYIQSIIDQIDVNDENVERFALPGSLNRELEDYTNTQITRGARYSNEHLGYEFGEGDDPFVYLVSETPAGLPKTDVVAFEWNEEIPEGFSLNEEAIIERAIRKPIEDIIEEAGWSWEEVRSGKQTKSMDLSTGGSNPFS